MRTSPLVAGQAAGMGQSWASLQGAVFAVRGRAFPTAPRAGGFGVGSKAKAELGVGSGPHPEAPRSPLPSSVHGDGWGMPARHRMFKALPGASKDRGGGCSETRPERDRQSGGWVRWHRTVGPGCNLLAECWWENPPGGQETGWEVGRWFAVTCGRGSSRKQSASQFLREGDRSPGAAGGPSCCLARLVDGLREPRAHPQRLSRRGQPPAPVSLLPSRSAHEEDIHLSPPLPRRGSHPPLTPQRTWGRRGPARAHVDETGAWENPTAKAKRHR